MLFSRCPGSVQFTTANKQQQKKTKNKTKKKQNKGCNKEQRILQKRAGKGEKNANHIFHNFRVGVGIFFFSFFFFLRFFRAEILKILIKRKKESGGNPAGLSLCHARLSSRALLSGPKLGLTLAS